MAWGLSGGRLQVEDTIISQDGNRVYRHLHNKGLSPPRTHRHMDTHTLKGIIQNLQGEVALEAGAGSLGRGNQHLPALNVFILLRTPGAPSLSCLPQSSWPQWLVSFRNNYMSSLCCSLSLAFGRRHGSK